MKMKIHIITVGKYMYYSRSLENVNQVYVFFILTRFINAKLLIRVLYVYENLF
mgnify:CR=1 FL=1